MGILDKLFHNRADVPVAPPENFVMRGPEVDPPEESPEIPDQDDIDGIALAIEYEHPSGAISSRVITCRAINPEPPGFLRAHCHLRHAYRTFRVDRIRSITDMETGEVAAGPDVLEFLAPYIDFAVEQDKAKAQRRFQRRVGPGIKVLVFLAAADGHVHLREQKVIMEYAQSQSRRLFPDQRFDKEATIRWINHLKPTRFAARKAAIKLTQDLDRFKRFAGTMISVVYADGFLDKSEDEAVRDIIEAVRNERGI